MKVVIFSDLDGTILDEKYCFDKIRPTIADLVSLNVDIVLCSSKTRAEIEVYRKAMKIESPFISENGAAIFIPKNFLKTDDFTRQTKEYDVIELGMPYRIIRNKIMKIEDKTHSKIMGFGDMSTEEVAKETGLNIEMAKLAKQREYDEPLNIDQNEKEIFDAAKEEGLCLTKGDRYYHLSGQHNKGDAVSRLRLLYAKNFERICTIGVGNGPNDLSLFAAVDTPFYVEREFREQTWKNILRKVKKMIWAIGK